MREYRWFDTAVAAAACYARARGGEAGQPGGAGEQASEDWEDGVEAAEAEAAEAEAAEAEAAEAEEAAPTDLATEHGGVAWHCLTLTLPLTPALTLTLTLTPTTLTITLPQP